MRSSKTKHRLIVHKMTALGIEEAMEKGEGPVEALEYALQYGKSYKLKREDVALYLLTSPQRFIQQSRKEKEDDDGDRGNI